MHDDVLLLNADGAPMSLLPLSTVSWKEAIRLIYLDRVSPIEFYEDWIIHSARISMVVPAIIMTKKFYENTSNVKFTASNVYLRDNYTCQYCGHKFVRNELTLDHYIPKSKGGKKSWDNIIAACEYCNHSRGNNFNIKPIKVPKKPTYYELVNNRKKYPIYIKHPSWNDYLQWDPTLISHKPIHEGKYKFDSD
jgi:5-methylcytosine-specific restriction endonuclease McrA